MFFGVSVLLPLSRDWADDRSVTLSDPPPWADAAVATFDARLADDRDAFDPSQQYAVRLALLPG